MCVGLIETNQMSQTDQTDQINGPACLAQQFGE
jgi:hypothetical protein